MELMTFIQILVNTLILASQYTLMACGFALIYEITDVFHFAHGITFILGAYILSLFLPANYQYFILFLIVSVLLCGFFGWLNEFLIYSPLRKKNSHRITFLVASLGIYIVCQNFISISFGDDTQSIGLSGFRSVLDIFGIRITIGQLIGVLIAFLSIGGLSFILHYTKTGKKWKACRQNRELASITGIKVASVFKMCFFIGSCLGGLAGITVCLDTDMTPTLGMFALIMAFVVYVVASKFSLLNIMLASIFLSLSQNFGGWYLGTEWKTSIAYIILLLFLLLRSRGLQKVLAKKKE